VSNLDEIKRAPASTGILDIIANRWSPRAFTNQAVSTEDLQKIFIAAAWVPSLLLRGRRWKFA